MTTSATALNVANTTIGVSGLTFQSISSNGAPNGIVLDTTGNSGGLTVAGSGGICTSVTPTCTGGRIQNTSGADGATSGIGVRLINTRSVSLSNMRVDNHQNFAIYGSTVAGFTLSNSVIDGTNGDNVNNPFNEGSIAFSSLTGSATIANTAISGGALNNVLVTNTFGSLNRLTFDAVTIGANGTNGAHGISIQPQTSATINVTVQNSTFTAARDQLFTLNMTGNSIADLSFTGNTLSNNHANIVSGGGGMSLTSGGAVGNTPSLTYTISTNSFRDADGSALLVSKLIDAGTFSGTITNNTIGVAAVANSGSKAGSGIRIITAVQGTHTVSITNNQIRQYNGEGILIQAGGIAQSASGTITHNAALNATITGNTIANPGSLSALAIYGIHLNAGTNSNSGGNPDAYPVCASISSNTIGGSGAGGGDNFILRKRFNASVRLPGYAGANDGTAAAAFVSSNNSNVTGVGSGTGTGSYTGGAACATP